MSGTYARFKQGSEVSLSLSNSKTLIGVVDSDSSEVMRLRYDSARHEPITKKLRTRPEYIIVQKRHIVYAVVDVLPQTDKGDTDD